MEKNPSKKIQKWSKTQKIWKNLKKYQKVNFFWQKKKLKKKKKRKKMPKKEEKNAILLVFQY